jgi:eukaryotic-like serine/threonine-protein kinase
MQENTTTTTSTPAAPRTDRLELVKELPRGSVGTVYKARNPQLERSTALRQFQVPEWLDDVKELLERILTEARRASALDHPNIARLYTCGYKDCTVFMTTEFVEGQTLKEVMAARTPDFNEILSWAKQLCAAVDYANDKGVFHHFLNPCNVKITADGTLKVLDFGLLRDKNLLSPIPAKKLEDAPYLSPEQVKGKSADRAANIFNVGVILYELYTTRSPFAGKHLGEIDRAITDAAPHALHVANGRVPEAISRVVLKALAKHPGDRFQKAEQLIQALDAAMRDQRPVSTSKMATGKFPAAEATGSFKVSAMDSFRHDGGSSLAKPSAPLSANATGALSRNGMNPAVRNSASVPHVAAKPRVPSPPVVPVKHKAVGSSSRWRVVGGVIAALVMLAAAVMLFQRRSTEIPADAEGAQATTPSSTAPAPFSESPAAATVPEDSPQQSRAARSTPARPAKKSGIAQLFALAPAAPAQGELIVSAVPLGATAEIEGRPGQWKTPQVIGPLAVGTYKVTVSSPGYTPETRSVQVTAGARTPVDLRLGASKGFIKVAGSPAGASILMDGKDTGKVTPAEFTLDPGSHSVTVRKTGYLEANTDLKLAAGQGITYAPSLMVAGRTDNIRIVGGGVGKVFGGGSGNGSARIEIKSEPKGAQVIVNGTPLQKATPVEIQVEAGSYDILLQKDGYKPVHESAIVGMEDRVKIDRVLTR